MTPEPAVTPNPRAPNRQLSAEEIETVFRPLYAEVKARIEEASAGDPTFLWALRRKLAKDLTYEERGKPGHRKQLKAYKMGEQRGKCALCGEDLPEKYAVLDRLEAMLGYTKDNTRLICHACDAKVQAERGWH